MRAIYYGCALALAAAALGARAETKDDLSNYVTDLTAGTVSAGNIVGLSQSAIQQPQSSQDLILAVKPLSSGASKAGWGIALSPYRTSIMPMSGQDYVRSDFNRLLASLTLSYAENGVDVASAGYRKSGWSADLSYYIDKDDDPVIRANKAFADCPERRDAEAAFVNAKEMDDEPAAKKAQKDAEAAVKTCVDEAMAKAPWNAHRISLSFGAGWIRPDAGGGSRESLGRSATLGGQLKAGKNGAAYFSLRRTTREIDLATLGASPGYKSSSLAALRLIYGSEDGNGDLKWLAEASNARASHVTESNSVFKYAVGIDKRVMKGLWLEFRLGRNRTYDGTASQTTGLLTLNFAPTTGLFAK
jgi:hypothetical protein